MGYLQITTGILAAAPIRLGKLPRLVAITTRVMSLQYNSVMVSYSLC